MNEILDSIKNRRSLRVFSDKEIPEIDREAILSSALEAPSAGNMTLYTIIDVKDQALKDRLAITCDNQPFIANAPMVLVFCADYYRWHHAFEKNCEYVRTPDKGDFHLACADAFIAAQNCVVAAESLSLGSCYIGDITENFEIHRELLGLPAYVVPVCMLVIGYPKEGQEQRKKPKRFQLEDIVFENKYDKEKADNMEEMLRVRQGIEGDEELSIWIKKFCERKFNSEFSKEMSRSVREMLKTFPGEN